MANTLLTISMITRESLRVLENSLTFTPCVRREYDDMFGKSGAKIGTVLNIRKPPRYLGRLGQALNIEDATESSVSLTLSTQRGVDISFSSQDLALSIDDFAKRFIRPAIANIANGIDFDGLGQYINVYNEVGTPGTVPNALSTYLSAGQRLDEEAAPRDDERYLVLTPAQHATLLGASSGPLTLFNPQGAVSEQYRRGLFSKNTLGFDWYMDQNCRVQVVGPLGSSPVTNGSNQTGASVITNGWTNAAAKRLSAGDVITLAGCNAVNPQNRQSTGTLRQFVVTADVSSDASGNATIPIYPSIITSGPFQTCSASPTSGGTLTPNGPANTSSPRGLAFHSDAFAFGCADLPLPGGVDMADRQSDKQLGMSIRLIRAYDISTDRWPCRLDILYGWTTLYPELAVRVAS